MKGADSVAHEQLLQRQLEQELNFLAIIETWKCQVQARIWQLEQQSPHNSAEDEDAVGQFAATI